MSVMTITERPASTQETRRWWTCMRCGKTLGEIDNGRVIIKIRDRVITSPAGLLEQTCSCGCVNVLVSEADNRTSA